MSEALVVAISPDFDRDRIIVVGGLGGVALMSDDSGESWKSISTEVSGLDISAVLFSPGFGIDRTLILGGIRNGQIIFFRSKDGGSTWERYLAHDKDARWLSVAISNTYSAEDDFFCFATGSHIVKPLTDQHGFWTTSLPSGPDTAVLSVALSPNFGDDQTVFVATSDGVFRSVDRGDNWIEMNVNLATRSILLIRPSPHYSVDRTVYAVTSGGELWRCSVSASTGSG